MPVTVSDTLSVNMMLLFDHNSNIDKSKKEKNKDE